MMAEQISPETFRSVLEDLPAAVYCVDRDRRTTLWNTAAEALSGYLRHEVMGRLWEEELLLHCDEDEACLCGVACPLEKAMHDGHPAEADLFLRHKRGHRVPVRVRAVPIRNEHGSIVGASACFERRAMHCVDAPRKASPNNSVDDLTGLPDHRATLERLQEYIENYANSAAPFGVVSMAIDGLDRLRHGAGPYAANAVLAATAQTLAAALGPNDMLGRWPGERFVAVVTGCTAPTLLRAAEMMKRLAGLEGVPWWGDRLPITLSAGGAMVEPGDSPAKLVGRAEAALEDNLRLRQHCAAVA